MRYLSAAFALAAATVAYGQTPELENKALAARIAAEKTEAGRDALLAGRTLDAALITAIRDQAEITYRKQDYAATLGLDSFALALARRLGDREQESALLYSLGAIDAG